MSLVYGDTGQAINNRRGFLKGIGIDYLDIVCAKQVHSNNVVYVKEGDKGKGASYYDDSIDAADALITDCRNLPLAVFSADCLSIFIYDKNSLSIALVHAGRSGTLAGIISRTIGLMQKIFFSVPGDLIVAFGPCIRSCCYKVKSEVAGLYSSGVIKINGHFYLDIAALNKSELLGLGVKEQNINDSGICTSCNNKHYYSYYKEGKSSGRIMSVMMLK